MAAVSQAITAVSLFDWLLYVAVAVSLPRLSRRKLQPAPAPVLAPAPPSPACALPDRTVLALQHALREQEAATGLRAGAGRPLGLLRALGEASVLTAAQSSTVLAALAQHRNGRGVRAVLTINHHASVPLDNVAMNGLLQLLCAESAATALQLYAALSSEYHVTALSRERLALAALQQGQSALAEALLEPCRSARAVALRIHAMGARGAVSAFLALYEEAEAELEDATLPWNSVLAALARNGRVERVAAVYASAQGRRLVPAVALALRALEVPVRRERRAVRRERARSLRRTPL